MLYDDMNISRIVVYDESIEESKLNRINRDLQSGSSDEKDQSMSKRGSTTKIPLCLTNKGCLTSILEEVTKVVHF